jgi:hypothetical protein
VEARRGGQAQRWLNHRWLYTDNTSRFSGGLENFNFLKKSVKSKFFPSHPKTDGVLEES